MAKHRGGLQPDKYLSEAQLKRLRQYVKDMADLARQRGCTRAIIDELVIELLVNTGLRASELCDLNIGDLPMTHGKDAVWVRDGKGNVARTVEVPESVQKRLERFVKLYRGQAGPDEPLLVSTKGKRVIYRSVYEKIRKLGRQCVYLLLLSSGRRSAAALSIQAADPPYGTSRPCKGLTAR